MSRNNPLPVSLQQECRKAAKIFSGFVDPVNGLDNIIPPSILRKAKGFCFITVVKAGFVFSARAGTGVVVARLNDGSWSPPSAVGTAGVGAGFQAGAEITEFMIILNSSAAVKSFMAKGSLTVGGNMSISAGPLGRNLEGTGTLSAKGGVSAMYSYSKSKGLFGGASIEGSIIVERSDANSKAYGFNVTAKQLLSGAVDDVPAWADALGDTIKRRSGRDNRIPGWIEDGDEIPATEWNSDDEGDYDDDDVKRGADTAGRRHVFRDDGLTPKEYGQRGYSFGSQYASGGSHDSPKLDHPSSSGGTGGGGTTSTFASSSPNRSRSGSATSKFGGMLGSIGRSRSGSGASMSKQHASLSSQHPQQRDGGGSSVGAGGGGPIAGDGHNFATKFESDYDYEQSQRSMSTSSPLRSPPLTKNDFSLIDAQDPFSESDHAIPDPAAPLPRPGLFSRTSSSKLTKGSKGANNGGSALRERVGQMNWDTFGGGGGAQDRSRESFESLDDTSDAFKYHRASPIGDDGPNRRRASTIAGGGSSNPADTLSSYHRPPLPAATRSRSFTSPFGGASSPFSKKNKKVESTAYDPPPGRGGGGDLYPIRSHDSTTAGSSDAGSYEFDEPEYRSHARTTTTRRNRGDSNPKPWDSEDETFLEESTKPVRPVPTARGGGAFDFRQVEADFAGVMDGRGLGGGATGTTRTRSGTVTAGSAAAEDGGARSRSGTVTQTSSKGAIGTAIAKYDFRGVESTDLPFSKHDVLVILNKDDEEWWHARLKLREGMIPRNYIGEIEWY
ncbi:hypothetical protein JCM11491_002108 [Sporobolomyces phaffii]